MYESQWVAVLVALGVGALAGFILGTRARPNTGGHCEVDFHWFFGWWVRCTAEDCPAGQRCVLLWRRKGSDEGWGDTGVNPGGSVKWSEGMEYRCECRSPAA